MNARIRLLSFTVWLTVWLLAIGAVLVILGIFNQQLGWDIFSPQVETFLYGVFFSCLLLSVFGSVSNIVPRPLPELLTALGSLSFVQNITLYVPNPQDEALLWRHSNFQVNANGEPVFERFLAAREFEEAIAQALEGNSSSLQSLNQRNNFTWYHLIEAGDRPLAVLKIDGNPQENFRDYTAEPPYQLN